MCVINFKPFLIYFFSFINISFLKFQADKNAKSIFLREFLLYFLILICVPGVYLPTLSGVVSNTQSMKSLPILQ